MTYGNKRANQQLSEFATKQIREMLKSRCYKESVAIKTVDPAYTSQIGKLKYKKQLGMSGHESAAW